MNLPRNCHTPNGVDATTNGVHHTGNPTTQDNAAVDDFAVDPNPAWTPRKKLRVITIGAGFSGLTFAYKLQHQNPEMQDLVSHTIFEAREDIGGTWLANVYPGVQCDVPAHIYAFPFDPNPDWTHFFATGKEIHEYMQKITKKWNLDQDVKLSHRVIETVWQAESGQWKVTVESEGRQWDEYAEVLVSGQGVLNSWQWPEIEGLHDFKGHKSHSANWDANYDYSHKRIALIGNGSTGVQVLPQLARLPETEILSFQRSPNWVYNPVTPGALVGKDDPRANPEFTEEEKLYFRKNPDEHRAYRKLIISKINKGFYLYVKDSPTNIRATKEAIDQISEKLKYDPMLCKALIPDWPLGCRRITPANGYLESFLQPNVQLITSPIVRITEHSILTADGSDYPVDVVACTTGYAVSWCPQWQMIGRNNVDLIKEWTVDPQSYLSLAAPDMPNYFMFLGPNAVVAHGSLVEAINWTGDYVIQWLRKIATEDIKSIVPKTQVVKDFIRYGVELHKKFVWTGGCRSWFKRDTVDGRVIAAFPGSALLFKNLASQLRPEDFEIEYRSKNRWHFLGNGFTSYELDPNNDLAWYVEK
ncbi:uncharacterized protein A1O5_06333 [Cladophialophora psammophila CBS 110553]|uniref:FAD/NAD(P)-binding domain-containing protein n=1 Tax=Cladophialophora psammophila CBS 110553 TaxID=1182543 RepID=W9WYV6_9EURO|nr:uncharacterized protein A1O5_06333 [Cladophialophora psammophila CBS 110553]EXJ70265.1 hypothetical protein A1O5_06333 [Cladophialophora psammophila CBS 110553]